MICVDSSVVVAAFAPWHEAHERAHAVVVRRPVTVSHCLVEVYSTLTRMPAPFRAPADRVSEYLAVLFAGRTLHPDAETYSSLPGRLAEVGVYGGAAYDGLIAESVRRSGVRLYSLDRRAARTYSLLGADFVLV